MLNNDYSAGGFSLEKNEISSLKEIETIAKPGSEDVNVSKRYKLQTFFEATQRELKD